MNALPQGPASPETKALKSAGAHIQIYPEIIVLRQDIGADVQITEIMEDNSGTMSKTFTGLHEDEELLVRLSTVINGKVISSISKIMKT